MNGINTMNAVCAAAAVFLTGGCMTQAPIEAVPQPLGLHGTRYISWYATWTVLHVVLQTASIQRD